MFTYYVHLIVIELRYTELWMHSLFGYCGEAYFELVLIFLSDPFEDSLNIVH